MVPASRSVQRCYRLPAVDDPGAVFSVFSVCFAAVAESVPVLPGVDLPGVGFLTVGVGLRSGSCWGRRRNCSLERLCSSLEERPSFSGGGNRTISSQVPCSERRDPASTLLDATRRSGRTLNSESDTPSPESFGCARCYGEDADATWVFLRGAQRRHWLVDQSHFDISIRQCPNCGQNFVWIFTEFIDWTDGEDPQYWDVLPITQEETESLAVQGENVDLVQIENLGRGRRRLVANHPKGEPRSILWASGRLSITPGH